MFHALEMRPLRQAKQAAKPKHDEAYRAWQRETK
jgi:hypothetical protein